MPDTRSDVSSEHASRNVARAVWGVLLIWVGAALLLEWSWAVGLVGVGAILLAAQGYRGLSRLKVDRFALVAGLLLVVCGVWRMLDLAVELVPLLFIAAGIVLLASIWTGRGARAAGGERADLEAPSHPRA
jgi:hypothetical protein